MGEPWSPTFSGAGAESHSAFELQAAKVSAFWVASDQWMLLKWNSKYMSHWEPDSPAFVKIEGNWIFIIFFDYLKNTF